MKVEIYWKQCIALHALDSRNVCSTYFIRRHRLKSIVVQSSNCELLFAWARLRNRLPYSETNCRRSHHREIMKLCRIQQTAIHLQACTPSYAHLLITFVALSSFWIVLWECRNNVRCDHDTSNAIYWESLSLIPAPYYSRIRCVPFFSFNVFGRIGENSTVSCRLPCYPIRDVFWLGTYKQFAIW